MKPLKVGKRSVGGSCSPKWPSRYPATASGEHDTGHGTRVVTRWASTYKRSPNCHTGFSNCIANKGKSLHCPVADTP